MVSCVSPLLSFIHALGTVDPHLGQKETDVLPCLPTHSSVSAWLLVTRSDCFFGAFPLVYEYARGWSPGISGLAFIPVGLGMVGVSSPSPATLGSPDNVLMLY